MTAGWQPGNARWWEDRRGENHRRPDRYLHRARRVPSRQHRSRRGVYKEPPVPGSVKQSAIILPCAPGECIRGFADFTMPIDLYHVPGSGPCRSVRLVAAAVGVDLNLKLTNLMAGEQMQPHFIKMNPQHTVPTLDDNGLYLWESRAISAYLVNQYGKNDSLYPKDPKKRAIVDQRLYFDMGVLYQAFADYYYPMVFSNAPKDAAKYEKITKAFEFLDKFLEGRNYAAGDHLTIADLTMLPTVGNFELMKFDMSKYKNVTRWFAKVKSEAVNYSEIEGKGLEAFKQLVVSLSKNPEFK